MERLSARVRARLREEMKRKDMSQRDVAGLLEWSQSRVAHLLTGRVEMGVDDLEGMAFAVGVAVTEIVRDRGLEFCAEMTPTEFRLYEYFHAMGPEQLNGFIVALSIKPPNARRAAGDGGKRKK